MGKTFALVFLGLMVLAGCVIEEPATDDADLEIANPASIYCETQGGIVNIITDSTGSQHGICTLEDGTRCEEWSYYRGECSVANKEMPTRCGECPMVIPPSPEYCSSGQVLPGLVDSCGCRGPPRCERVVCTLDAKTCPDGTSVGRMAPDCNFAKCPGEI